MSCDSENIIPRGTGMFFETEAELLQYREDERKRAERHLMRDKAAPTEKNLVLVSLRDLLAEPDESTDWIVDGLLPKGGLSVIVAKPKAGKSTLARQLALCVARGEDFLSRETAAGLVVYLALEERRGDVKGHFRAMGADGEEPIKVFAGMAPADAIAHVREMAMIERPVLIVVDTLARLARIKDLNDYAQTTEGIQPLLAIAREVGSHVCLLHHARKGESKGIDSILGSTGIAGSVDTIVALHRCEKYRTISSIQRVGEDIEETVLDFDTGRRWTTLGDSREQAEIDRVKAAILDFLQTQGEPVEEKAIGEGIEATKAYRVRALRQLVSESTVERYGEGKRGNPYLYKKGGSLVRSICCEPENQNPKDDVTFRNAAHDSGSRNFGFFDSGSQEKSAVQTALAIFPGAVATIAEPALPEEF